MQRAAWRLHRDGLTASAIGRVLGVGAPAVRRWLRADGPPCDGCGTHHALDHLPADAYAYLLGMYLGDGHIDSFPRTYQLNVTLDAAYPAIVAEVAAAIAAVRGRPIFLAPWQKAIAEAHAQALLRGLIHSDGWRGDNRVRVKGREYAYPRYQFSNRSDDIRTIFTDACDVLGIAWRPWGRWHISVARREAVARMDEFIGPKT